MFQRFSRGDAWRGDADLAGVRDVEVRPLLQLLLRLPRSRIFGASSRQGDAAVVDAAGALALRVGGRAPAREPSSAAQPPPSGPRPPPRCPQRPCSPRAAPPRAAPLPPGRPPPPAGSAAHRTSFRVRRSQKGMRLGSLSLGTSSQDPFGILSFAILPLAPAQPWLRYVFRVHRATRAALPRLLRARAASRPRRTPRRVPRARAAVQRASRVRREKARLRLLRWSTQKGRQCGRRGKNKLSWVSLQCSDQSLCRRAPGCGSRADRTAHAPCGRARVRWSGAAWLGSPRLRTNAPPANEAERRHERAHLRGTLDG